MPARLEHLHIVRRKRAAPEPLAEALLEEGRGIPGDHHDRPGIKRAVTLIRAETLDEVAARLGLGFAPGASRRNLTVRGLDLDALGRGAILRVGGARLEVHGPCDPCVRMEKSLGPGALALLQRRGGLVTRIVSGGRIAPGDEVSVEHHVAAPAAPARDTQVGEALLAWFGQARRDLPWRRTQDPYAVWVSEVMLQQTQVATVIPYWEKFLARFPTVTALATAPLDDVLAHWSGLGYYARARNLHRAAQAVVERHAGVFPRDLAALQALPGFGPYTAGAVGSIALGLDATLVDGNVARVFCRLEGWELGAEEAREQAWEAAARYLPKGRAGDFNQALMELGATVCTPATPKCAGCPITSLCGAAKRGDPTKYPLAKVRRARKRLRIVALAVRASEAVLLLRREAKGLFGGLWELPGAIVEGDGESRAAALEAARTLFAKGAKVELLGRVEATLTHRDVEVDVFGATGTGLEVPEGARFVAPVDLRALGLSTLAVRVLAAARVDVPEGHGRRRAVDVKQQRLL